MKNLFTILAVSILTLGFSQSKSSNGLVVKNKTLVENVGITVEVDSADEIEKTFKVEDIKEILESTNENETITFKIICNGKTMSNGKKSHMSYKIEGNSDEMDNFLNSVEKIRTSAINYYNNKK